MVPHDSAKRQKRNFPKEQSHEIPHSLRPAISLRRRSTAGFQVWLSSNPDPAVFPLLVPVLLAILGLTLLLGHAVARKHRIERDRKQREATGLRIFVESELLKAQTPRPGYQRREG